MSPVTAAAAQPIPAAPKIKRPPPPGIQTNGVVHSASSPSPSIANKKTTPVTKQPTPNSASDRNITVSTVRGINRARREATSLSLGRNSRNSAGIRTDPFSTEMDAHDTEPPPYVITDSYILKKHGGQPPSLVVHLHATHFRFDSQDGMFQYKSPMRIFLEHVRTRTVPHELLQHFVDANVPFYDGCLIVQIHDHKSAVQAKDTTKQSSSPNKTLPSSIHNSSPWLTPSPYVPFPKDQLSGADDNKKQEVESKVKEDGEENLENVPPAEKESSSKAKAKPKVFTVVMHPTPESLAADLRIKAITPKGADAAGVPPSTPHSLLPPTPTTGTMPPPAKRVKKEKTELDGTNIHAAEGQILVATNAPLMLEPTQNVEETIALLEAMAHPNHSEPPPQPKTRKRTVAEVAADEAAAAEQERYMLVLDERLSSGATGAQGASGGDGDGQAGSAAFEPRFERFKVIADIKREHAEKKEAEQIKQAENERRIQKQKQEAQQAQQEQLAAQRQAEAEKTKRENAAREAQLRQQVEAQRLAAAQRQAAAAAAAAASTPVSQPQQPNKSQQHAHPNANGMAANNANGGAANNANNTAQARFQSQMQTGQASSPVVRQGTPQNMSSPMVGGAPMQQTNSGMAGSPPRPPSVVQNPMSAPMAPSMSVRGSQQSHQAGTPRMPSATPNMAHATPVNRQAMATPHMSQSSPPPNMMAQNSQMGQNMMMNNQGQGMSPQAQQQLIAQMAAQQRQIQQQQQFAAMQNGGNAGNANLNLQNMTPQQQQQMMQMMQRQLMLQQQQQQQQANQQGGMVNPQQQQQWAQYAQQLQNMQGNQFRQMTPQMQAQMQAQLQQMARMGQLGGQMGNNIQRQMSGQMMNGNNMSMQGMGMGMQGQPQQHHAQQQFQQQQMQQQQQQQQQQQGQQQMGANPIQVQVQNSARSIYQRMLQQMGPKYGGPEHIPQDIIEKLKQSSLSQANQMVQNTINQRRMMLAQQQQQAQQQQAMQGMGGMMGQHQGM